MPDQCRVNYVTQYNRFQIRRKYCIYLLKRSFRDQYSQLRVENVSVSQITHARTR